MWVLKTQTLMKTAYGERVSTVLNRNLLLASVAATLSAPVLADAEYSGMLGIETRYFLQDAAYPGQSRTQTSFFIEPEIYTEWNDRQDSLLFKPFARADEVDEERTHYDVRELMWLHVGEDWESRIGIGKVFWGQTESLHLVDIINQTDTIEQVDGEDKLGQPMISVSAFGDWGTLTGYVLPYFRERTFSGWDGRLRPPVPIDDNNAVYESSDEERHIDYALRWKNYVGDWEIGLSYFDGTSREPELIPPAQDSLNPMFTPYYAQIQQVGLDMLTVAGAWLLKFEGIYRTGQSEDFAAAVVGFERTSVGVFGTQHDLGVLMEYQYDERKDNFFAIGQNDLMLGLRWVWNDLDGTEVLTGMVQDLDESETYSAFIEASSRMTDNWRWKLDGYFFSSNNQNDTYYYLRRDDHLQFSVEYFF